MSFDIPLQTGARELSVKMNFFIVQGGNALNPVESISVGDVHYRSEEDMKMAWMRET